MTCKQFIPISAIVLFSVCSLPAQTAGSEQLYCLSAAFNTRGKYPTALNSIEGGTLHIVRKIFTGSGADTAVAVDTIRVDYDRRKLVITSPNTIPHRVDVIDMSAPLIENHVNLNYDSSQMLPLRTYLLEVPGRGLFVAYEMWTTTTHEIMNNLLTVSVDTEHSSVTNLPVTQLTNVRVAGYVGGALPTRLQTPEVRGNPLHILLNDPTGCATNIPRPPYIPAAESPLSDSYDLAVVNDSIDVLVPFRPPEWKAIDILDKSAGTWHRVSLPFEVSRVRAFGSWIAAMSTEPRAGVQPSPGRVMVYAADTRRLRASPGKNKRLAEVLDSYGNSVDERFDISEDYFPGDLVVLNGHTGQIFTIHTGEGDSEVVLVTDSAVYYRVNDALYEATISSGKLGNGVKVAEGPAIVQVHWAFLGPAL